MFKFFLIVHGGLIFIGLFLLLFYAKIGHQLDQKMSAKGKIKLPKVVKVYGLILLTWIAISSAYFFLQLLT